MDISIVVSIIAVGISFSTVIILIIINYQSNKKIKNQKYIDLFREYRKVEMLSAIQRLHKFKKKYKGKCIKCEYKKIKKEEDRIEKGKEYSKKLDFKKNTLHYQRRLVSQFYMAIDIALKEKLLPEELTLKSWTDLKIIKIIREIGYDPEENLKSLYEKGMKYRKKKE